MYGWINQCVEDLVVKNFGLAVWEKIKEEASCYVQNGEFIRSVHYDDAMTVQLVGAASKVLNMPAETILEVFGCHFVEFLEQKGYSGPIRGQGSTLREWIYNINEPHRLLRSRFPQGSLPEFWTEEDTEDPDNILLHYYSTREGGLGPVVVGVVKTGARKYFDREVTMELILSEKPEKSAFAYHAVWRVGNVGFDFSDDEDTVTDDMSLGMSSSFSSLVDSEPRCPFHHGSPSTTGMSATMQSHGIPIPLPLGTMRNRLPSQTSVLSTSSKASTPRAYRSKSHYQHGVGMDQKTLTRVFPFHVAVNQHMQVIQLGSKMNALLRRHDIAAQFLPVGEIFSLAVADDYTWSWKELAKLQDAPITIRITSKGPLYSTKFAGEVVVMNEGDEAVAIMLVNPVVADVDALLALGFKLTDLPRHAFQRDVLQIEEHLRSELQHSLEVTQLNQRLESEARKAKESLDALRTKRVFVRYVSHEIRTPLNVALLGLKCLEEEGERSSEGGHASPSKIAETAASSATSSNTSSSDTQKELVGDIRTSCSMAVDILNDLLLYEKMDDGLFSLSSSDIVAVSMLQEVERLFQVQAKAVEVKLTLHIPKNTASLIVHADRSKINQVLRNLVSNAIKFTRPGGTVTISCELRNHNNPEESDSNAREDDNIVFAPVAITAKSITLDQSKSLETATRSLRISVSDSGCGISREDQQRLFGQFVQFKAEQLQRGQGSGLGLWIASNIVHMHGGRIGATSAGEGKGSTFLIDLPLPDAATFPSLQTKSTDSQHAAADAAVDIDKQLSLSLDSQVQLGAPSSKPVTPTASQCRPMPQRTVSQRRLSPSYHDEISHICRNSRVLLVDDSMPNRKMLRRILHARFRSIDEAENGLKAVERYEAAKDNDERYDLVLMDGNMPVMDGLESTRRIMQMDENATVVGVTGNAFDEDIAAFRQAGAVTVLVKPLNLAALEDVIWLRRHQFAV